MKELSNKQIHKNRVIAHFIEAVQQIIEMEGIENVSIRKIAQIAHYNSATLYNYFKDIDQLILLSLMKYLKNYLIALSNCIVGQEDSLQMFMQIWMFHCETAFGNPLIFSNLFFSKYSDQIDKLYQQYEEIFPDRQSEVLPLVADMSPSYNFVSCNIKLMLPLAQAGYIKKDNLYIANEMLISYFHTLLCQKCTDNTLTITDFKNKIIKAIYHIIK